MLMRWVSTYSLLLEVSPGTWVESFSMNCTRAQDTLPQPRRPGACPLPATLGGFEESIELTAESSLSTPEADDELPLSEPMYDVCTGQENFSS